MKNIGRSALLMTAALLASFLASSLADAATAPQALSGDEIKFMELKERSLAPGFVELSPVPMSAEETELLAAMESASGLDPDSITAGSSLIDLIIVILLIYLILRLLD